MIERRGRFHQLIKNSKKKRCDKEKNDEQSKRNQEMTDYIEKTSWWDRAYTRRTWWIKAEVRISFSWHRSS